MHQQDKDEVVCFVGFSVNDPHFFTLGRDDMAFVEEMADAPKFSRVTRHGQTVGYGVPIIASGMSQDFRDVTDELYRTIEEARTSVKEIVSKLKEPLGLKSGVYCLSMKD